MRLGAETVGIDIPPEEIAGACIHHGTMLLLTAVGIGGREW
jgi:hypothetical protein